MHVRVVRFTDVTAERVDGLVARIEESGAPPEDAPITGLQMLLDADQGTAIDPTETPGTRASVDMCEVKLERRM